MEHIAATGAFRHPLPRPASSGKIGDHAPRRGRSARRDGGHGHVVR
jgi:hypothetical protein